MMHNPPVLEAVKVSGPSFGRSADATYIVLEPATGLARDKRAERRWRTHLRSGKVIDGRTHILAESFVRDRSARGMRLRLAANVPLPERIRFFDDVGKRIFEATIAWRRGREIGVRVLQELDASRLSRAEQFRLGLKPQAATL